jgi:hypothetical protein
LWTSVDASSADGLGWLEVEVRRLWGLPEYGAWAQAVTALGRGFFLLLV